MWKKKKNIPLKLVTFLKYIEQNKKGKGDIRINKKKGRGERDTAEYLGIGGRY